MDKDIILSKITGLELVCASHYRKISHHFHQPDPANNEQHVGVEKQAGANKIMNM